MGARGPFGLYRLKATIVSRTAGLLNGGNATVDNVGLFIQDAWTMGRRLKINVGLRRRRRACRRSRQTREYRNGDPVRFRRQARPGSASHGMPHRRGDQDVRIVRLLCGVTKLELSFAFGALSSVRYRYTLDSA